MSIEQTPSLLGIQKFLENKRSDKFEQRVCSVRSELRDWLTQQYLENLYQRADNPDLPLHSSFNLTSLQSWLKQRYANYPGEVLMEAIADLCGENYELVIEFRRMDVQSTIITKVLSFDSAKMSDSNLFKARESFETFCRSILNNYTGQNLPIDEDWQPSLNGKLVITDIDLSGNFGREKQIAASCLNMENKAKEIGDSQNVMELRNSLDLIAEYIQIRLDLLDYDQSSTNRVLKDLAKAKFLRTLKQVNSLSNSLELLAEHSSEPSAGTSTPQEYFEIYGISEQISKDWRKDYAQINTNSLNDLIGYAQNLCYYIQRLDGLLVQLRDPKGNPRKTLKDSVQEFERSMELHYSDANLREVETSVDLARTEQNGGFTSEDFEYDFSWISHIRNVMDGKISDELLECNVDISKEVSQTYRGLAVEFLNTISDVQLLSQRLRINLQKLEKNDVFNNTDVKILTDLLGRLQNSKTAIQQLFDFQYSFKADEVYASNTVKQFFVGLGMLELSEVRRNLIRLNLLRINQQEDKKVLKYNTLTVLTEICEVDEYVEPDLSSSTTQDRNFLELRCLSSNKSIAGINLLTTIRKSELLNQKNILANYQDPVRYIQGWYFLRAFMDCICKQLDSVAASQKPK